MVGENPHKKSIYQIVFKKLGLLNYVQSNDKDYKCELYDVFIKLRVVFLF
jgi:hypothetical protein